MSKKDIPYTAMKKPVGLLFGGQPTDRETEPQTSNQIAIAQIKLPSSQPRRYFDSQKLEELSRSIKQFGILEPLLVRPSITGDYELVAGERRFKAAQLAGLTEVPVVIREMDDNITRQVRLVENLQREDLNPVEETEGILELLALSLSINSESVISVLNQSANAKKRSLTLTDNVIRQVEQIESILSGIGRNSAESFRVNRLPLLNLPEDVLDALRIGKLEYTKARALATVKDPSQRTKLLDMTIAQDLALTKIKELIVSFRASDQDSNTPSLKSEYKELTKQLGTSKIWHDPKKKKTLEKLLNQIKSLLDEETT